VNANDGGGRKFIIAQLPEEIIVSGSNKEKKVAQAAINFLKSINKPTNVAELAKERIRRAAAKIRADFADKLSECKEKGLPPLDTGFRTYRVDDTNMKDVFYHPSEVTQESLLGAVDKVKADRNPEDLLTQVMLELGITLDLSIETLSLAGNTVYAVAGNALLACFDTELHEGVIDEIAKREPLRLVLRDATFGTGDDRDQKRVNFETRMKRLSPDTVITVL
jgi:adenine-specific DNA-methyltransferase